MSLTPETARWFSDRRGIQRETLEAFGIETEGEGVTFPYPDGAVKHRATLDKVEVNGKLRHRMWFAPTCPDGQPPFLPPGYSGGKRQVVWEGETDTMAAWQAAPSDMKPCVLGMGGANAFGPKGLSAERIQAAFGDVNERAKTAIEKSTKLAEEMTEITKGNVEALVASSKVAARGVEALGQEVAEFGRRSFEEASTAVKSFAEVKSPTDLFRLQSEFAKNQFDSMIAESSRLSETVIKLAGDVIEPLSSRYSVAAERVKSAAL